MILVNIAGSGLQTVYTNVIPQVTQPYGLNNVCRDNVCDFRGNQLAGNNTNETFSNREKDNFAEVIS